MSLNLANNGLGGRAALVLAQSLHRNQTLRELVLDGNAIGRGGVRALLRCVAGDVDDPLAGGLGMATPMAAPPGAMVAVRTPKRTPASSDDGSVGTGQGGREDPRSISMVGCNYQVRAAGWLVLLS